MSARAVAFSLRSSHPVPYQLCDCGICRKQQGGAGFAIKLSGHAASLKVKGEEHVGTFHARMTGTASRNPPERAGGLAPEAPRPDSRDSA